jgi:hypothetical protein
VAEQQVGEADEGREQTAKLTSQEREGIHRHA